MDEKTVSYSQLRNWLKCPHYHYRVSVTKEIPYPTNKYTVLGTSVHNTCEQILENNIKNKRLIRQLLLDNTIVEKLENPEVDRSEVDQLLRPYFNILPDIPSFLERNHPDFSLHSTEYKIDVGLNSYYSVNWNNDYRFVGYVDLILKNNKGEYLLVDWKTSTKGWNKWKRKDDKYTYQLPLYSYFFAKNLQIPLEKVRNAFIIFNARDGGIEEFVPPNDWQSALKSLRLLVHNAYEKKFYPFNKACRFCECEEYKK